MADQWKYVPVPDNSGCHYSQNLHFCLRSVTVSTQTRIIARNEISFPLLLDCGGLGANGTDSYPSCHDVDLSWLLLLAGDIETNPGPGEYSIYGCTLQYLRYYFK